MINVAVIGAGPAGLSAALWLENLGLQGIGIEKAAVTGGMQNYNILDNDWVLGQQASTGADIAKTFYQHIEEHQIPLHLSTQVTGIQSSTAGFHLQLSHGDDIQVRALLLATGTRYIGREIFADIKGFAHVDANYLVDGPYAFFDLDKLDSLSGQKVVPLHIAIIGAGDNAFENALLLLEKGCQVSIISRTVPKAQKKFTDAISYYPLATIYEQATITQFEQAHDALHISLDSNGAHQLTSVYSAGDNSNSNFPCVVSAVASGALAAKTISRDFA